MKRLADLGISFWNDDIPEVLMDDLVYKVLPRILEQDMTPDLLDLAFSLYFLDDLQHPDFNKGAIVLRGHRCERSWRVFDTQEELKALITIYTDVEIHWPEMRGSKIAAHYLGAILVNGLDVADECWASADSLALLKRFKIGKDRDFTDWALDAKHAGDKAPEDRFCHRRPDAVRVVCRIGWHPDEYYSIPYGMVSYRAYRFMIDAPPTLRLKVMELETKMMQEFIRNQFIREEETLKEKSAEI